MMLRQRERQGRLSEWALGMDGDACSRGAGLVGGLSLPRGIILLVLVRRLHLLRNVYLIYIPIPQIPNDVVWTVRYHVKWVLNNRHRTLVLELIS